MPPFRPSLPRLIESTASAARYAAREALAKRQPPKPFPVIAICPPSSCACSETPQDLEIDYKSPLNGAMPAYQKHVLVLSGQSDWLSKVEDEQATSNWGKFTATLKKTFGRGGEFHDPYMNIPVNTCSFKQQVGGDGQEVLLFPAFKLVKLQEAWQDQVPDLASYIVSGSTKDPAGVQVNAIRSPTVLVCTHAGRDKRCGVLGPLLVQEFQNQLRIRHDATLPRVENVDGSFDPAAINVGGVSHVGGHKWAGNVIVYIPPEHEIVTPDGSRIPSPLAGKGVWYGRVEPRHVDGILNETILGGRVIQELFRGGIDHQGNPLRI